MDLGLIDKVALVTGAGSQKGYGKGIAMTLAREGCDVIVADIDLNGAQRTAGASRRLAAIRVDPRGRSAAVRDPDGSKTSGSRSRAETRARTDSCRGHLQGLAHVSGANRYPCVRNEPR